MNSLSLHSTGKKNHLKSLKKEYKSVVKKIKEKGKKASIKRVFKAEKRGASHNLY